MMTRGGEGGKKCRKFDDVICERPLSLMAEKLKSTKCKHTRKSKYLHLIPFTQLSPHGSNLATGNLKSKSVDSRLDNHFHTCIAKGFTCLP